MFSAVSHWWYSSVWSVHNEQFVASFALWFYSPVFCFTFQKVIFLSFESLIFKTENWGISDVTIACIICSLHRLVSNQSWPNKVTVNEVALIYWCKHNIIQQLIFFITLTLLALMLKLFAEPYSSDVLGAALKPCFTLTDVSSSWKR